MRPISTDQAPAAIGPYNQAIAVPTGREMIFCSGQIPIDPANGHVLEGDCAEQTALVMSNLAAVLEAAGCTLADVVKTTIYLTDMNDFAAVNAVYGEAMNGHRPARATVQVSRLPKDVSVEIDAIAVSPL